MIFAVALHSIYLDIWKFPSSLVLEIETLSSVYTKANEG